MGQGTVQEQHDTEVKEGILLAGRYRIGECLGTGGMGAVYLAVDTLLENSEVALKVLHKNLNADEKQLQRFLREVQLTRQITHKNIVRTFDVGQNEGRVFYSMEYVPGSALKEVLERYGKLQIEEAVPILVDIASGLQAIHSEGVIHRDLKPANIILSRDGLARITDFGVARPKVSDLTHHTEVVGSTAYLSPEAWTGKNIQYRTDLYALGVMAYEMLTGVQPFVASSPAEYMFKHLEENPASLREHDGTIPGWLDHLVLSMLAKDQFQRPESAEQIAECLAEGIGGVAFSVYDTQSGRDVVTEESFDRVDGSDEKKIRIRAIEASLRDTMSRDDEEFIEELVTEELSPDQLDLVEGSVTSEIEAGYVIASEGVTGVSMAPLEGEESLDTESAPVAWQVKSGAVIIVTCCAVVAAILVDFGVRFSWLQTEKVGGHLGWALMFVVSAVWVMFVNALFVLPFAIVRTARFGVSGLLRQMFDGAAILAKVGLLLFGVLSAYKVHLMTSGSKAHLFISALGGLSDQLLTGVTQILYNALTVSLFSDGFYLREAADGASVRAIHGFTLEPYYLAILLFAASLVYYLIARKFYQLGSAWFLAIVILCSCFLGLDYFCLEYFALEPFATWEMPFGGSHLVMSYLQLILAIPKIMLLFYVMKSARS